MVDRHRGEAKIMAALAGFSSQLRALVGSTQRIRQDQFPAGLAVNRQPEPMHSCEEPELTEFSWRGPDQSQAPFPR